MSSQAEARKAIKEAKERVKEGAAGSEAAGSESEVSDDEGGPKKEVAPSDDEHASPATASPVEDTRPEAPPKSSSHVARDVIGRKGQYGRFAERWFSKNGWSAERRRSQGMSVDAPQRTSFTGSQPKHDQEPPSPSMGLTQSVVEAGDGASGQKFSEMSSNSADSPRQSNARTYTLLPKLLRTTRLLLVSQSFFFSYDLDITRRLGTQELRGSELPLHKSVDLLVSLLYTHYNPS